MRKASRLIADTISAIDHLVPSIKFADNTRSDASRAKVRDQIDRCIVIRNAEAESEEGKIPFAAHASEVRDVEGDFLSPITQIIYAT